MVPNYVRQRRVFVEERLAKLQEYADTFKYNVMEINDPSIGVITSGASYLYTKEVFPNYSYLKLGMVWPLPKNLIAEFFKKVKKVMVVEELDPFLETEIRAMGFKVFHGKDIIPRMFELSPETVEKSILGKKYKAPRVRVKPEDLPRRPPNMCAGCSHRPLFYALKKLGAYVWGDIGCYTLANAAPPPGAPCHYLHGRGRRCGPRRDEGHGRCRSGQDGRRARRLHLPPLGRHPPHGLRLQQGCIDHHRPR